MNDFVEYELDWSKQYGKLSPGEYRVGKTISDFEASGVYIEGDYHAILK